MKSVAIDTNIYSEAMRGNPTAISIFQDFENLLIPPVVLGEILFGFKGGKHERRNINHLRKFLAQKRIRVPAISENTSDYYALILYELKQAGTPIPTNDIWIAASTMENGVSLASRDKHFEKINGLLLIKV